MAARVEQKEGGGFGRVRTLFSRTPRGATPIVDSPRASSFAEKLDQWTAACIRTLKQQTEDIAAQHSTLSEWAIRCCQVLSLTPLGIKDPLSWQNQRLLEQFQKIVKHSVCAKEIHERIKGNRGIPLPDHVYRDLSHRDCEICLMDHHVRVKQGKALFQKLLPEEPYIGSLGEPLKE